MKVTVQIELYVAPCAGKSNDPGPFYRPPKSGYR